MAAIPNVTPIKTAQETLPVKKPRPTPIIMNDAIVFPTVPVTNFSTLHKTIPISPAEPVAELTVAADASFNPKNAKTPKNKTK